jgi:8-oxo-dGTP pyrophosphatase MutT (NUDIX family)
VAIKNSIECWLLNPEGKVLLLQVPARPGKHEAFWQPVTGGIEEGEKPHEAALREIWEETGFELDQADLTEIASGLLVEISPDLTISKTLYTVGTPHSDVITHRREHQDFRWLAPGEVSDSLLWESNRQTWERVSQPHQS